MARTPLPTASVLSPLQMRNMHRPSTYRSLRSSALFSTLLTSPVPTWPKPPACSLDSSANGTSPIWKVAKHLLRYIRGTTVTALSLRSHPPGRILCRTSSTHLGEPLAGPRRPSSFLLSPRSSLVLTFGTNPPRPPCHEPPQTQCFARHLCTSIDLRQLPSLHGS